MKKFVAVSLLLLMLTGCHQPQKISQMEQIDGGRSSVIYCVDCGIIAGRSSKCPVEGDHHFKKSSDSATVVCVDCGAMPSRKASKCPVEGDHHFREF